MRFAAEDAEAENHILDMAIKLFRIGSNGLFIKSLSEVHAHNLM